ncbi:PIN domain nuclease, a component of toxin-antitoxin system (PIN domain) [Dyadobacter soli]|uniref:PIN domain nuclease, a component of toxin-antitoxin system (PIN domain) n=1 Tax=Dyadobacter soli TaxID=659014 RepID=A0A1G7QG41_9BACT|nr:type II toxin-antitoxin system VapC family toxin [Dyadobacter soli]SDF97428.1 PIN domain nuclease, a component of toxin-antitoxin system (PIN domain) [Dyadobacter soli]
MKYILDTHTLIWFLQGNAALSKKAKSIIEETDSQKFVSIASIWEIAIKVSLEKIVLAKSLDDFLLDLSKTKITVLPIELPHALRVSKLDFFHRDPFDRLIIAQSIEENLEVLTRDSDFSSYGIITRW